MKTIKLLLIEDEINLAYVIKSVMENVIGGYEVDLAFNGKEGLEHYKSFTPDVIVSDIEMPVMNGLEMVKIIRETNLEIPIVFTTARINSKDVTVGYGAGVDNYIKKPFSPDELDAHVKTLINIKNKGKSLSKDSVQIIGKYMFNPKINTLTCKNSNKRKLTSRESQILEILLENKGKMVKRDYLIKIFWDKIDTLYASRSLDVFISKLRSYLADDKSISIRNIKSTGLILDFD